MSYVQIPLSTFQLVELELFFGANRRILHSHHETINI